MAERRWTAKFHFSPADSFQLSRFVCCRRAYAYFIVGQVGLSYRQGCSLRALHPSRPALHPCHPSLMAGFVLLFAESKNKRHDRGESNQTSASSLNSPLKEKGGNMSFQKNIKKAAFILLFCSCDKRSHALAALLNSQVKKPATHHATD